MKMRVEPLWHMELAVLGTIFIQFGMSDSLSFGSKRLIIVLACVQLLMLILIRNSAHPEKDKWHWRTTLLMTAFLTIVNIGSLTLVLKALIQHPANITGQALILTAIGTFLTNIIIFALWYWQLDGGGPGGRGTHNPPVDFLFTQMVTDTSVTETPGWRASFFDYLYLSVTNATAFSPTDVLPLSHRAKLLMMVQSFTSFATVVVVAARAINILS